MTFPSASEMLFWSASRNTIWIDGDSAAEETEAVSRRPFNPSAENSDAK